MGKKLWIGSYLDDEMTVEMRKIGYSNPASVLSQKNILEGIEEVSGNHFDTIGALAFGGYPKEKVKYFKCFQFSHAEGSKDVLVPFINLKYINKASISASLKRATRRYIRTTQEEISDVYIYEMRSACLLAAKEIKEHSPETKIHLIVPDLPQFMDLNAGKLKKKLKAIDWKRIQKNMKYVDDYILYAAPMAEFLGLKDGSWMVMEGSINQKDIENAKIKPVSEKSGNHIVMYSGSIQKGFGIQNLLDAMSLLDDSYELWFTGGGDYKETVKAYAEKDSRIKYYGFLPTRDDVKRLQSQATMLINMRNPDAEASSYCFPSKIFEFMLTGKPVLSFSMDGIPQEYYNYLIKIKDKSEKTIAEAIKKVSEISETERMEIGTKGREFVVNQKNNIVMANRIVKFTRGGVILSCSYLVCIRTADSDIYELGGMAA